MRPAGSRPLEKESRASRQRRQYSSAGVLRRATSDRYMTVTLLQFHCFVSIFRQYISTGVLLAQEGRLGYMV